MAKRVKTERKALLVINDWAGCDKLVKDIGDRQLRIAAAEARAKEQIDTVKAALAVSVQVDQDAIKHCLDSIEAYAANHIEEFGKNKSRKLNYGSLGWRSSTSISTKKDTLALIKAVFSAAKAALYIRSKDSVNKDTLGQLTDEQLATINARRERKDVFFVEPDKPKAADYHGQ